MVLHHWLSDLKPEAFQVRRLWEWRGDLEKDKGGFLQGRRHVHPGVQDLLKPGTAPAVKTKTKNEAKDKGNAPQPQSDTHGGGGHGSSCLLLVGRWCFVDIFGTNTLIFHHLLLLLSKSPLLRLRVSMISRDRAHQALSFAALSRSSERESPKPNWLLNFVSGNVARSPRSKVSWAT